MARQFTAFAEREFNQGLRDDADHVHASALTRARAKVPWQVFQTLHQDAVAQAQTLFPQHQRYQWKGLSVYAVDGSHVALPATAAIRAHFDPHSGLDQPGRGHYPQALVTTVYDVFRRLPVARSVVPIPVADERKQAERLLPQIPSGGVLVFDRGYPSAPLIQQCLNHYNGHVLLRCPATGSFAAVTAFIKSGVDDAMLTVSHEGVVVHLRAIRLRGPDGRLSVLLTSMQDRQRFSRQALIKLYRRRWAIETHYRTEKCLFQVEQFHARTVNGVLQELFALLTVMIMAQTFAAINVPQRETPKCWVSAQLRYAITALGDKVFCFIARHWRSVCDCLERLAIAMTRHVYYQPKIPKPSQPRVSKTAANKWRQHKTRRSGA